ncbi:hypothetical protein BDR26DRAFT_1004041 [Obelidium mucronatum]|nr:hypothetical protein BDR26DRAFT_1004041 [Obelidium mucronatum]
MYTAGYSDGPSFGEVTKNCVLQLGYLQIQKIEERHMPPKRKEPVTAAEEAKKAEQNRQHQRDFRDRQKDKLKLLEDRVAELERELALARGIAAPTSNAAEQELAHLRQRLARAEAQNAALRHLLAEQLAQPPAPLVAQSGDAALWETLLLLDGGAEDDAATAGGVSTTTSTSTSQNTPTPMHSKSLPNMEDVRQELKLLSFLKDATALIDEFCDYVNTQNLANTNPLEMMQVVVRTKNNILGFCNLEEEKRTVLDILDRGRKQNSSIVDNVIEKIQSLSVVEKNTHKLRKVDADIGPAFEKLRSISSIRESTECLDCLRDLEAVYIKEFQNGGEFDKSVEILRLKHRLMKHIERVEDKKAVFDVLLKLKIEG